MTDTSIIYNSIEIGAVHTESMDSTLILDDTHTIPAYVLRRIRFRGYVQATTVAGTITSINAMQRALTEPRKNLTIKYGSETLVAVQPARSDGSIECDALNGPMPEDISITSVHGGRFALISGTITWAETVNGSNPIVVSHRFEQTFSIDHRGYTRRTVSGKLILSGRVTNPNPDEWRCYVWPMELPGAARESAEFIVGSDGLSLSYRVVDQEKYRAHPVGVLDASGTYSVTIIGTAAARVHLQFKLEGNKRARQADLLKEAFKIVAKRINFETSILDSITIQEDLFGANSVEVTVATRSTLSATANPELDFTHFRMFKNLITEGIGADGRFKQITPYGTALVRAAYQALFDPDQDGNPSSPDDLPVASLEEITGTFQDLDGDGVAEWTCGDTPTILAAESTGEYGDEAVAAYMSNKGTGIASEEHLRKPYIHASSQYNRTLINDVVVLPTASKTARDIVQQTRKPRIIETHTGVLQRQDAAPEIPTPEELTAGLTGRGAILTSFAAQGAAPIPAADGASMIYAAGYTYTTVRVFDPDSDDWAQVSPSYAGGAAQPMIAAVQPTVIRDPLNNPMIDAGADREQAAIPAAADATFI